MIGEAAANYVNDLPKDRSTVTVIEAIDISEFNKSRHANGRLSMFARGQLTQKLVSMLNWEGHPFVEVEPAYTSQTCPVCGYTDKGNRDGKEFRCKCCGHEDDADHVGAVNICERGQDSVISEICESSTGVSRRKRIKAELDRRHFEWIKQQALQI